MRLPSPRPSLRHLLPPPAGLLALSLLAGCIGAPTPRRIRVRRDPSVLRKEAKAPKTYAEFQDQQLKRSLARQLPPSLVRSDAYIAKTVRAVDRIEDSIPEDPWQSYEADRVRVLERPWADLPDAPPGPNPNQPAASSNDTNDSGD